MVTITIGRDPKNTCVYANTTVSSNHAVLTVDWSTMIGTIKDLNSTNGTFVNGKKITGPEQVKISDIIKFGNETTSLSGIKTKIQARQQNIGGNGGSSNQGRSNATPGSVTIGRASDNKVAMTQQDVSGHHAELYKGNDGSVIIRDLGSTNGTYVNGIKISSAKALSKGDRVMIANKYSLDWERIMSVSPNPNPNPNSLYKKIGAAVAGIAATIAAFLFIPSKSMTAEEIYETYNESVCLVYGVYGYTVDVVYPNGQVQHLSTGCHVENGEIVDGGAGYTGTGFFISEDGKLATNLHVVRPWLFEKSSSIIENHWNSQLAILARRDPMYARCSLKVNPVLAKIMILPNGLPASESNFIECQVYRDHEDKEKDVAVIQTMTRKMAPNAKTYFDLNKAALEEEEIKEGRNIFSIGYPTGFSFAFTDDKSVRNQIYSGKITQNRGTYTYGHDVVSQHGASGSPMIDEKGRLIGVLNAGLDFTQGMNMAIKVKHLKNLLD